MDTEAYHSVFNYSTDDTSYVYVNDIGSGDLAEMGDYLARGVYFKTDADFAVVCENMTGTAEYLVKEYSIKNGEVVEEKTFYSEKLPVE